MRLLLDTNALIKLCHPRQDEEAQKIREWLKTWLARAQATGDHEVIISAAADYEARRGYLWKLEKHPDEPKALARLDQFCELLGVYPLSQDVLHDAARFWSNARKGGYSTGPERDVDWDVLVAAQAKKLGAVVVTTNSRDISRYGVDARNWDKIPPP